MRPERPSQVAGFLWWKNNLSKWQKVAYGAHVMHRQPVQLSETGSDVISFLCLTTTPTVAFWTACNLLNCVTVQLGDYWKRSSSSENIMLIEFRNSHILNTPALTVSVTLTVKTAMRFILDDTLAYDETNTKFGYKRLHGLEDIWTNMNWNSEPLSVYATVALKRG